LTICFRTNSILFLGNFEWTEKTWT